jgi:hypothetical protein
VLQTGNFTSHRCLAATLALLTLHGAAVNTAHGQSPSVLIGIVGDTAHAPLPQTEVMAVRSRRKVLTDQRGIFVFTLRPGEELFLVRRVGYLPQTFEATLVAGDTIRVGVMLGAAPVVLPDLVVEAEGTTYRGRLLAFGQRLTTSGAPRSAFLTRKDIEKQHATQTVHLLVGTGMKLRPWSRGRTTVGCPRGRSTGQPRVAFYVDGAKTQNDFDVNDIRPDDIEAIEVYRSAAERPAQYNATGSDCAVLIWLRDGS